MEKKKRGSDILPRHIAVIMDGNGRWAEKRGLPRAAGHSEGLKSVRKTIKTADKQDIKYLTLYSFSTENWSRPEPEIKFLLTLMEQKLKEESDNFHKENIRVMFIGDREKLPSSLHKIIEEVTGITQNNTGLTLIFAINYGSRQEITDMVKRIIRSGRKEKEINEELVEQYLYTASIPAPDLIIRTSGEKRLSNFLLWQAAYAELYFTPVLWPDFDEKEFLKATASYSRRKRKFGGIKK